VRVQRFQRGDHVRIADDLGPYMSHFRAGCDVIVVGSYADQYGGDNRDTYTVFFRGSGGCSWYDEHQLTLIEASRTDLLNQWEHELEAERALMSDIDWIFAHGADIVAKPHGASVQALADCFDFGTLWGANGEGIDYDYNFRATLHVATPFLLAGNKFGWMQEAAVIRDRIADARRKRK
jgi:hypothetical protein